MRKLALALLAIGLLGSVAIAQDQDGEQREGRRERREDRRAERRNRDAQTQPGPRFGPEFFDSLNLTDEQKPKVREIMDAHQEQMQKWQAEHKDELARLEKEFIAAREAKDQEKMREVTQQLQALRQERAEKQRELVDQLQTVLDEQQMQKVRQRLESGRRGGRGGMMGQFQGLDLTEAQQAQIKEIMEKARTDAEGAEPQARRQIMQTARQKVIDEVLTPEQKEKLEQQRKNRRDGGATRPGRDGEGRRERRRDRQREGQEAPAEGQEAPQE